MSATLTKVEVPDIGDFDDVPVIEILVSVGDSVAVEDPLVTLESDKATMDVPAPFAGVVKEISVSVGDRVAQGTVLMGIEADGDAGASGDGDAGGGEPVVASRRSRPRPRLRRPSRLLLRRSPHLHLHLHLRPRPRPRRPTVAGRSTPARRRGGWPASSASTCGR
jgi:pyruvate/2-oxoglutarate dehydrogenase complex dihydrolipoamide acyltransferase (E2) component